jgi:hypothetical protein
VIRMRQRTPQAALSGPVLSGASLICYFESPLLALGSGGSSSIGGSKMTGEPGGDGSIKFPRRSWARSNASTLRRNSSSPAHARSRKALRSTTGCWRASVKMATARAGSSLIRKSIHSQPSP